MYPLTKEEAFKLFRSTKKSTEIGPDDVLPVLMGYHDASVMDVFASFPNASLLNYSIPDCK